jgi:hypothetical protein
VVRWRLDKAKRVNCVRGWFRNPDQVGTVSQVIRMALAEFEPQPAEHAGKKLFVSAFTYGGALPVSQLSWRVVTSAAAQTRLQTDEDREGSVEAPTSTEPTRVSERVTVGT